MLAKVKYLILLSLLMGAVVQAHYRTTREAVDTFPVPKWNALTQFYVQRTPNTNTIVYDLNWSNGKLNEAEPLNIYWIRYTEDHRKEGLSWIQRKFAYGIKSKKIGNEKYQLKFTAYDKVPLILEKNEQGKYHTYVNIEGRIIILQRLYIRIDPGGSFWSPNVKYVEFKGLDVKSGKVVCKIIYPDWKPPKESERIAK